MTSNPQPMTLMKPNTPRSLAAWLAISAMLCLIALALSSCATPGEKEPLSPRDRESMVISKGLVDTKQGATELEIGGEIVERGDAAVRRWLLDQEGVLLTGAVPLTRYANNYASELPDYQWDPDAGERWLAGRDAIAAYGGALYRLARGPVEPSDYKYARKIRVDLLGQVHPLLRTRQVAALPELPRRAYGEISGPGWSGGARWKRALPKAPREFPAKVERVIDGDTFVADIDVVLGIVLDDERIRVAGFDAVERNEPRGQDARLAAAALLGGKTVTLRVHASRDKYGRVLAGVTLPDGTDFAALMEPYRKPVSRESRIRGGSGFMERPHARFLETDEASTVREWQSPVRTDRPWAPFESPLYAPDWLDRMFAGRPAWDSRLWSYADWDLVNGDRIRRVELQHERVLNGFVR